MDIHSDDNADKADPFYGVIKVKANILPCARLHRVSAWCLERHTTSSSIAAECFNLIEGGEEQHGEADDVPSYPGLSRKACTSAAVRRTQVLKVGERG